MHRIIERPPLNHPQVQKESKTVGPSTSSFSQTFVQRPYTKYRKTILKQWTSEDYMRHKKVASEHEASKLPSDSILSQERSIVCKAFNVQPLKRFMHIQQRCDRWWIVPDTRVLLDDRFFADQLVKTDRTCRMLLPYTVLHDLSAMTHPRLPAWMRIPARRVAEYLRVQTLDCMKAAVVVQGALEAERIVNNHHASRDAVINACLQMNELYFYVLLISDDPVRRQRAAECNIPAYTLDQVRSLVKPTFRHHRECPISITRSYSNAGNSSSGFP